MHVPSGFFRRVRRALKLLAIASLPFIIAGAALCCWLREWALRDLPDIPEPFDIEAVAYPEIPADRNAFELYRLASERLRPLPDEFKERYSEFFRTDWLDLPGPLQEWLADNREALDAYRQGSERPQALYIPIGDQIPTTQLTVTQNLQHLSLLATLEARRLAAARQVASAWEWQLAVLRSSRHSGRNGTVIERLVGCMTFARAMRLIGDWSTLEGVDAELLRRALRDVRDVQQMTVPTSDTIKAEYVGYRKMLRDPALFDDFFEEKRFIPPSFYLT